jgi:hypothetical protein
VRRKSESMSGGGPPEDSGGPPRLLRPRRDKRRTLLRARPRPRRVCRPKTSHAGTQDRSVKATFGRVIASRSGAVGSGGTLRYLLADRLGGLCH